jgi:hypothetical protein
VTDERAFGERLARRLRGALARKYLVDTGISLFYAISFDDAGNLRLPQSEEREPLRGGGTGFEQDLLIFERSAEGTTSIVPRVAVELKFGSTNTHDSIVYSEKARRIRAIYPYLRYGMVLGGLTRIPARTLRLGTEFDFIVAAPERLSPPGFERLVKLLRTELAVSKKLTSVLRGVSPVGVIHRSASMRSSL